MAERKEWMCFMQKHTAVAVEPATQEFVKLIHRQNGVDRWIVLPVEDAMEYADAITAACASDGATQ